MVPRFHYQIYVHVHISLWCCNIPFNYSAGTLAGRELRFRAFCEADEKPIYAKLKTMEENEK